MFGTPVAYFFEYLLGIRQPKDSGGYKEITISPECVDKFSYMNGSMMIPAGKVAVSYVNKDGETQFTIEIPDGVKAEFAYKENKYPLSSGVNKFLIRN